jgi:DNA-binding transcriptional MocR family regulator
VAQLTDDQKNGIRDALLAQEKSGESITSIAARFGVAKTTVSRAAKALDLQPELRTMTKNATEAKRADMAAQRAELSQRALDMARGALDEIESGEVIVSWTDFGSTPVVKRMNGMVTPKGRQALTTAFAIAMDKHRMLDQYDAQQGLSSAVDDWLLSRLGVRRGDAGEEGT